MCERVETWPWNVKYDPREGRPKSATEIIWKVHVINLEDQRTMVREIIITIEITKERVCYIYYEKLYMKNLCKT